MNFPFARLATHDEIMVQSRFESPMITIKPVKAFKRASLAYVSSPFAFTASAEVLFVIAIYLAVIQLCVVKTEK